LRSTCAPTRLKHPSFDTNTAKWYMEATVFEALLWRTSYEVYEYMYPRAGKTPHARIGMVEQACRLLGL